MSSATSPDLSELRSLPWLHGRSPEVVRTEQESRVPPVIQVRPRCPVSPARSRCTQHKYLLCASAEERMQKLLELFKHRVLYNGVLQHKAAALVFVNSGSTAMTVANALLERHMRVGVVAGADLTLGVRDSKKARHDAVRGLVKRQLQVRTAPRTATVIIIFFASAHHTLRCCAGHCVHGHSGTRHGLSRADARGEF